MVNKILFLLGILIVVSCSENKTQYATISKAELINKIKGGWAGKMIGVRYGSAFEFKSTGKIIEDAIHWSPEMVEGALEEDDLYVQLTFLSAMGKYQGLKTPVINLAEDFAHADYGVCHANLQARKNLLDGIMPPLSGTPKYNMHANDIDFQIESDFIGFMNPGMPSSAVLMADSVGRILAYGDGLYGGMFVAAMHSLAFFEKDAKTIVVKALKCIPAESKYAQAIQTVIAGYNSDPKDWKKTWAVLQEKYGDTDICVPFHPFNIDASLNGAYIVMGLLYGNNDLSKTIEIAVRCGQDTDCNAASTAGIIGVMCGYDAIDENFKSYIPKIEDKLFFYTNYSFNKAVLQTHIFAEENILANGGRVKNDIFKVKLQEPRFTGTLEQSFPGKKASYQVLMTQNDQYQLIGNWKDFTYGDGDDYLFKVSTKPGDIFDMNFKGTGFSVKGRFDIDGGTALAYIDDKPLREFNCYYPGSDCAKWDSNRYHIISAMDLNDGEHQLKIEVLNKKQPESRGNKIYIERVIIYE